MIESGLIFAPEQWHNHASCIVELPNGDMLACWYHGSGERTADDVLVEGARLPKGSGEWTDRFLMAETPGYPDCNPIMFVDGRGRLWLMYVTILANEWHTALLKYRIADHPEGPAAPSWDWSEVLHVTPGEQFVSMVVTATEECEAEVRRWPSPSLPTLEYLAARREHAESKFYRRLGWMPRARPTILRDGRIVLPLYSDGFDFSLMMLSDDDGESWHVSAPLISFGGVQPSVVEKTDGTLTAYMRDNGPAPTRVMRSVSTDRGESWSAPEKMEIPNPGSGLEVIRLKSGRWLMVCNDTEHGRHRLAVISSDDEGERWPRTAYLENDDDAPIKGGYGYPSIIQRTDDSIWITYTHHTPEIGNTIKWVRFTEDWAAG